MFSRKLFCAILATALAASASASDVIDEVVVATSNCQDCPGVPDSQELVVVGIVMGCVVCMRFRQLNGPWAAQCQGTRVTTGVIVMADQ